MGTTRREFLAASAVAGGALWLGGCGGSEEPVQTGAAQAARAGR